MGTSTAEQLSEALRRLPAWALADNVIRREYRFKDFAAAIAFVNRVAALAEAADHHPDIDVRYSRVAIALTTHNAGGVTDKDIDLATQLDAAFL